MIVILLIIIEVFARYEAGRSRVKMLKYFVSVLSSQLQVLSLNEVSIPTPNVRLYTQDA